MKLAQGVLLVFIAVAIVMYGFIVESLDWVGRAEIIEKRAPFLWRAMNNRPMRLLLLLVAVAG